jgi:hypothetical protein
VMLSDSFQEGTMGMTTDGLSYWQAESEGIDLLDTTIGDLLDATVRPFGSSIPGTGCQSTATRSTVWIFMTRHCSTGCACQQNSIATLPGRVNRHAVRCRRVYNRFES